jgi:transposase
LTVGVGRLGFVVKHRTVVSNEAWAWLEPLLPSSAGRRGGRWRDHRQVIEAISWKYRTGSPWRELPERYGPWQTAYERLSRWSADGTWARLLARAQTDADAAGELDWLVAADSTMVRVHQHGATARRLSGNAATVPENHSAAASAAEQEVSAADEQRAGGVIE